MFTRITIIVLAISLLSTGLALADVPPFLPTGSTSGDPQVGPDWWDACNNGAAAAPQELGYGGNSSGSSSGTGGSGYHRYTNGDNGMFAYDLCLGLGGIAPFPSCVANAQVNAITTGATMLADGPLPDSVFSAIYTIGGPAVFSGLGYAGTCGGLLGSGTDGEMEWGMNKAVLNVRAGPGPNGGDGLNGCYGGSPGSASCGGAVGCLSDNFVSATAHHGTDTKIYVEDFVSGGSVGFTVASDWSRPANTSSSGVDLNTQPGRAHCGDGAIEPCLTATPHRGVSNDERVGDTTAFAADLIYLTTNTPTTSASLAAWNEVRNGCNPDDYSVYVPPQPLATATPLTVLPSANNVYNNGVALSGFGKTGYTGGAAGYLLVLIDDPASDGFTFDLNALVSVTPVNVPSGGPTIGWVWTG